MPKARSHPRRKSSSARLNVSVLNHCRSLRVDRKLLAKVVRFTAAEQGITAGQVELAVFGDKDMARLHKEYLGRPKVTDVICFDLAQGDPAEPDGPSQIRASLALGGQVARKQARLNRTSINKELALYTVHGLLHVFGYNDAKAADARRMHRREDELLEQLGLGAVFHKSAP
ncbi:MAG: rRNA maturation RNase YbeY [Phycisphaerae bacterium]|nr:rRNA maturation RNase YbeY [Phycisphaerae bacterium]